MDARETAEWWRRSGRAQLTLVLWAVWDPIGSVPLDEYEIYVDELFSVLEAGAEADRIADELERIRTKSIRLPKDRSRDVEVAQKLKDWHYWAT